MPKPPPKQQQATSYVVRRGRVMAERATGGGRAQAPTPFRHDAAENREARENNPPPPQPIGP